MLPDYSEDQQQAALRLLISRGLAVEDWDPEQWLGADGAVPLRQHNLIRSVAYELLKADSSAWHIAEHQAAQQWLTGYEPALDVPNLETVRGYLEAFHHYCEGEDWDAASELFMRQLKPSAKSELYWLLHEWSYCKEQLKLCRQMLEKASPKLQIICQNGIGTAYYSLSNYCKAIAADQESLNLSKEIGDRQGEGKALGNLGTIYIKLGEYQQAIDCIKQYLDITQETGDRRGEGIALGNLAIVYNDRGEYQRAIDYHQKSLAISQELGDRYGESCDLGNLGTRLP